MSVAGRVVVVTGASSGIGAATARAFAAGGARVALVARDGDRLAGVAAEIVAAGGNARHWAVDCAERGAVGLAAPAIESELGVPDVIVNAAGAGRAMFFEETSPEEFERAMAAPFVAALNVTRAFIPGMLVRRSGVVVNVGSPAAYVPWPGAAGYAIGRWAMRGLSEVLHAELRGTGVRCTNVVPARVESSYFDHNPGFLERVPWFALLAGKLTPERVGDAIVRAAARDRRDVFVPFRLHAFVLFARLFPGVALHAMVSTGARRERDFAGSSTKRFVRRRRRT
jgi:short-subunit dehydrogenase